MVCARCGTRSSGTTRRRPGGDDRRTCPSWTLREARRRDWARDGWTPRSPIGDPSAHTSPWHALLEAPMPRLRPDRPNVVVFFTDQQRWDSVGLHGNPLDLTPNLDR